MLELRNCGLFCPAGGFAVDPQRPVERAIITHAHADHARGGSKHYLCSTTSEPLLKIRLPRDSQIQSLAFGEPLQIGDARVSLHPAGHILGSAQVRIEVNGYVSVVGGDYKLNADRTCESFEPQRSHLFVTESTFGLPIFKWKEESSVFAEFNQWWAENAERGDTSVVFAYALGKAQRVLAGLNRDIGPIAAHGAAKAFLPIYRGFGVDMPPVVEQSLNAKGSGLVIAPPSALNTPWLNKYRPYRTAFASGWMQIRGNRRRRGVDKGFVLSDHADWDGLLAACDAEEVWVTHGYQASLARFLREQGKRAVALESLSALEEE